MEKQVRYIMSAEEHGELTCILGEERKDLKLIIDKIEKDELSKENTVSLLKDVLGNLDRAYATATVDVK